MSFSKRFGYEKPPIELSEEEMPKSLQAGLWDCLYLNFFQTVGRYDILGRLEGYHHKFDYISRDIWVNFFKEPSDTRPHDPDRTRIIIRDFFFNGSFNRTYDLLEFMCADDFCDHVDAEELRANCNLIFERELAQFRFAGEVLVKITNSEELASITDGMDQPDSSGVSEHIRRAAQLYSQRPEPDYRNSVKESISAVEAAVRFVTNTRSHGVAKPLRAVSEGFDLHPALRDGFEKLYAYTSDEDGVRHAIMDKAKLRQEDARYMLISCSAFANYLIALKLRAS